MNKLNIKSAVLVGVSMGGSVAAWTTSKSSNRVKGLIMIAPSAYPRSLQKDWPYNWLYRPGITNRLAWIIVNNPLFYWLYPESLAAQALGVTSSYDHSFSKTLKQIQKPTLLTWSPGDKTALFKYHKYYKDSIPQLKFIELPRLVGHAVLRKYPFKTAAIINDFIESNAINKIPETQGEL